MTEYACDGWCGGARRDGPPLLVGTFDVGQFRESDQGTRLEDAGVHPDDPVQLCASCVQRLLLQTPGAGPTL